ncbi:MAG: FkbM family methyltransferase [Chromatiales bacterium]|nr:FkbM family methyltransferase [Chromatiales bacterium]
MNLSGRMKQAIERLTGTRIFRFPPRGVDMFHDIAAALPMFRPSIVFDVGANVGQSARLFLDHFPDTTIHCFEPSTDNHRKLRNHLAGTGQAHCHRIALGAAKADGTMVLQGIPEMYFLREQSREQPDADSPTESVTIDTIDAFCERNAIERIGFLKIDTEGSDLEVLKGATDSLARQSIDLVLVEAGMSPTNQRHVSFENLKQFLESHEYYLFGIYEQIHEWTTREPHLRRTNLLFLSRETRRMNQKGRRLDR